jgi:hypothetical protein
MDRPACLKSLPIPQSLLQGQGKLWAKGGTLVVAKLCRSRDQCGYCIETISVASWHDVKRYKDNLAGNRSSSSTTGSTGSSADGSTSRRSSFASVDRQSIAVPITPDQFPVLGQQKKSFTREDWSLTKSPPRYTSSPAPIVASTAAISSRSSVTEGSGPGQCNGSQ